MPEEWLINLIHQYGYFALFFALWLGIVGMPIPDEVIVMTAGMVTALGLLQPVPAFIMTYLGVASGLSIGYVLGRIMGPPVLERLQRRERLRAPIVRAREILGRYGNLALSISYLFPVVRHVIPYLVGINQMPFRRYLLYSYSAGLVWTLIYFVIGHLVGENADVIWALLSRYVGYAVVVIALGGLLYWLMRRRRTGTITKS